MKALIYKNAAIIKFNNRRVGLHKLPEGDFALFFKILTDKTDANNSSCRHSVEKDKLKTTTVRISKQAAVALYHALEAVLEQETY